MKPSLSAIYIPIVLCCFLFDGCTEPSDDTIASTSTPRQSTDTALEAKAGNDSTLIIACSLNPDNPVHIQIKAMMKSILEPLGYKLIMPYIPQSRIQAELEQGRIDGDCARTNDFFNNTRHSFPLRAPVSQQQIYIYQTQPFETSLDLTAHLQQGRIIYLRGTKSIENLLAQRQLTAQAITDYKQIVKMMIAKRADFSLGFKTPTDGTIKALGMTGQFYRQPIGEPLYVYVALHNRHIHLRNDMEALARDYIVSHFDRDTLFPISD